MKTITHDAYVAGVQEFYLWHDIIPGDPNEGQWEDAHYPAPRALGDETIQLLKDHHIIQGLLQSEEYQRCCFHNGPTKPWLDQNQSNPLYEYLLTLYKKWSGAQCRGTALYKNPDTGETERLTKDEAEARGWVGRSAGMYVYKDPDSDETAYLTREEATERGWCARATGKTAYKSPRTGEIAQLTREEAEERGWTHVCAQRGTYRNPVTGETAKLTREEAEERGWVGVTVGKAVFRDPQTGKTAHLTKEEADERGWVGTSVGKAAYKDPQTGEIAQLTREEANERGWVGASCGRRCERKECPHCGTSADTGNYTRHHGDNCVELVGSARWFAREMKEVEKSMHRFEVAYGK